MPRESFSLKVVKKMFRFFFSLCCSVIIARWIYQEVQLAAPELVPFIDYSLDRVQIPTHDKWLKTALSNAVRYIDDQEVRQGAAAGHKPIVTAARLPKKLAAEAPEEPLGEFSTTSFRDSSAFERF
jgi:hypothetical protein